MAVQTTMPEPGAVSAQAGLLSVALKAVPKESVSVTTTALAAEGPRLVTVTV